MMSMEDLEKRRQENPDYNPDCPACFTFRQHTDEEYRAHKGQGRDGEDNRNRSIKPNAVQD